MKVFLQCLGILVGLTAFLPFIPSNLWWIRGLEFPRMQMLTFGLIIGIALFLLGVESLPTDGAVLGFLGLSILVQAWWMRPYSKLARCEVLDGRNEMSGVSVFIANVLMSNRESRRLLDLIRTKKPDIIIAVETDDWWVNQLRELAFNYPHAVEVPQNDTYGMTLRSRLPLIEPSVESLVKRNIPSIYTRVQLAQGEIIHLYALHPKPPFPDEDTSTTNRDGELLIVGKRVEGHGGPTIVAGDLNDVAWSETTRLFQKISGLLDPRIGRGRFNSYHANHWWLRWPLDHVFLSDHFRLRRLELQPGIGSDHFPILAELTFEPDGRNQQNGLEKDQDDEQEARQEIAEATEQKCR